MLPDDFVESGALAKNTGLDRLEIIGLVHQNRNDQIWVGPESLAFLSMLPGAALSNLDIVVDNPSHRMAVENGSVPAPFHISTLDKLLTTTTKFASLRRVHLHLRIGGSYYGDEVMIKKAFATCQEKGLLAITTS